MKKKIFIASFDMEVGGVERSLLSLLENLDYNTYHVDLMLYRQQGEFLKLVPHNVNILTEIPAYTTFRKSIPTVIKERHYQIGFSRIRAKLHAQINGFKLKASEPGYYQSQLMWKYTLPMLPTIKEQYDVAISYLWPHYFVAEKVEAHHKIAWIHTDYSTVQVDKEMDYDMWATFDSIIAVSEACREAFLNVYKGLDVKVVENMISPMFVRKMATKEVENPMLNDTRFKIVTVARLSHAKGIDMAIKALKQIIDSGYKNLAWYVVGYGGDEQMLYRLIANNHLQDHFFLLGKKVNPYPFMKAADLYVQPSRYEGKAVTVTEAQILAKPVLITNYPTAASQLKHNVDGCICALGIDGLVTGIKQLIHHTSYRNRLAENTKQLDYSNKLEIKKLYQTFEQEVAGRS
ncbi:MAG: glycosyltransferase [Bacillota bacterium]|nr:MULTISPECIES: glycosyltransferase [Bacillaceae]